MASTVRLGQDQDTAQATNDAAAKASEDSAASDAADGTQDDIGSPRPWWKRVAPVVLLVVAIGSIATFVVAGLSWRSAADDERRNVDVLRAASTMAADLVTLSQQTADEDLSRVIDGTTGAFRDQFVSAADGFGSLLTNGGVDSTGEVKAAGIVDASDDQATVLAAVTSTVTNNEAPDGEVRVYRMKLTLDNTDGRWLVSNVEFVA